MKRRIILSFLGFSLALLAPSTVKATDFKLSYQINYQLDEQGNAVVKQEIELQNLTRNRYVADYTFSPRGEKWQEVRAFNAAGELPLEVKEKDGEQEIKVILGPQTAGWQKITRWTMNYKIASQARQRGRLWELILPRLETPLPLNNYQLTISVPLSYGPLLYALPAAAKEEIKEGRRYFFYHSTPAREVAQRGLEMTWGDYQLFNFKLLYHLQNPLNTEAFSEIALLPHLPPGQKIYLSQLSPAPRTIKTDLDQNILALYLLAPGEKLTIQFQGQAQVRFFPPTQGWPRQQDEEALRAQYTRPARYWPVNDQQIQKVVQEVRGEEKNHSLVAEKLYRFTVKELSYNQNRFQNPVQRLGAREALNQPDNAVCMEYTDLLITLLRAAEIPARELDGYAYAASADRPLPQDILHSWVQFYDPQHQVWRAVDPTWESTAGRDYFNQLDLERIIFVVKGLDSEKPYPAGSYKLPQQSPQQDIFIQPTAQWQKGVQPLLLWWQNQPQQRPQADFWGNLLQKIEEQWRQWQQR